MLPGKTPFEDRFWAKVDFDFDPGACWLWTGAVKSNGYGHIGVKGQKNEMAHRVSWGLTHGPIPDDLYVCHRCDVRRCVRPAHLFLGTATENCQDMVKKGRNSPPPRLLSDDSAREVKRRLREGESFSSISKDFALSKASIRQIAMGRTYREVP